MRMPWMTLNSEPGPVQRFHRHCKQEKERVTRRETHIKITTTTSDIFKCYLCLGYLQNGVKQKHEVQPDVQKELYWLVSKFWEADVWVD